MANDDRKLWIEFDTAWRSQTPRPRKPDLATWVKPMAAVRLQARLR
jgi:hypothetical protein